MIFTISKNAEFNVTTNSGMGYGTFETGTTTIKENAKLYLKQQSRNGSYPTWYKNGGISTIKGTNTTNISSNNYTENKFSFRMVE